MFTELPEFPIWLWFSKWPPKWRKIDLARISAKIDIQGKHDVTSSSMTSKITTELHFQKGQGWTRHCPSICSQLGFRTFGALLIFCILASHDKYKHLWRTTGMSPLEGERHNSIYHFTLNCQSTIIFDNTRDLWLCLCMYNSYFSTWCFGQAVTVFECLYVKYLYYK
jgi:hypothetical protein